MGRRDHWEVLLHQAIEAARRRPFAWGDHDCCLWAGRVVETLTGADHWSGWAGGYSDPKTALRALRARGLTGPESVARHYLGPPLRLLLTAQRGDVVLAEVESGEAGAETVVAPALGVCVGKACAFPGPDGLAFVPLRGCALAWPVGRPAERQEG